MRAVIKSFSGWIGLVLVAAAAGALATWMWMGRPAATPTPAQGPEAGEDVVGWLAGTPGLAPGVRRAVLIDRAAGNPEEVELIVNAGRPVDVDTPTPEELARDVILLEATERSLARCRRVSEANAVIVARSTLKSRVEKGLSMKARLLKNELEGYGTDAGKALNSNKWAADVDRIQALADQAEVAPSPAKPLMASVVAMAMGQADKQLNHAKSVITALRATVETSRNPVEPVSTTAQNVGRAQAELNALGQTLKLVGNERLRAWATTTEEASVAGGLADFEQQLSTTGADLTKLQLTLYNLWAIRQIYAAEDTTEWTVYLGSVDRGVLHPSVAAMWNLVHDRRFAEVQDRAVRPAEVRRLLTAKPVALERF